MKRETKETLLWIFMIVVLLFLTNYIEDKGATMDCNQCTVTLQNKLPLGEYRDYGEFKIRKLFGRLYLENICTIKWDPTQGYYLANEAPQ